MFTSFLPPSYMSVMVVVVAGGYPQQQCKHKNAFNKKRKACTLRKSTSSPPGDFTLIVFFSSSTPSHGSYLHVSLLWNRKNVVIFIKILFNFCSGFVFRVKRKTWEKKLMETSSPRVSSPSSSSSSAATSPQNLANSEPCLICGAPTLERHFQVSSSAMAWIN